MTIGNREGNELYEKLRKKYQGIREYQLEQKSTCEQCQGSGTIVYREGKRVTEDDRVDGKQAIQKVTRNARPKPKPSVLQRQIATLTQKVAQVANERQAYVDKLENADDELRQLLEQFIASIDRYLQRIELHLEKKVIALGAKEGGYVEVDDSVY